MNNLPVWQKTAKSAKEKTIYFIVRWSWVWKCEMKADICIFPSDKFFNTRHWPTVEHVTTLDGCCKNYTSATVSNKNTHLADFETFVFHGYLRKSYLHLFASLSKELSDEKNNFWNPVTKSADICKNAVLPEKSNLLEKSAILINSKTFFDGSKG